MFETFALWLHDDTFSKAYILVLMAVMVLPMVLLARWYHGNITNTEGGRKLMARQDAGKVRPRSLRGVADGAGMAHDISAGRYGEHARNMQRRVYIYVFAWLLAVGVLAGLLITAQALYPPPGIEAPFQSGNGAKRN
jgi:hypothetical protein